jgi:hypothetical protein
LRIKAAAFKWDRSLGRDEKSDLEFADSIADDIMRQCENTPGKQALGDITPQPFRDRVKRTALRIANLAVAAQIVAKETADEPDGHALDAIAAVMSAAEDAAMEIADWMVDEDCGAALHGEGQEGVDARAALNSPE